MIALAKRSLKRALASCDIACTRRSATPEQTLLGLKKYPIRTVIDAGANLGQFATLISGHFPQARVYCFEPLPTVFARLQATAGASGGRIEAFHTALGEQAGEVEMHEHIEHPASSSLLPATELSHSYYPASRKQAAAMVRMETLDGAVERWGLVLKPDLLVKMDVQGYEDRVVRGGQQVLRQARACWLEVCLDVLYEGQATFAGLLAQMEALGLSYAGNLDQSYDPDGHVRFVDALFLRH